MPAKTLETRRHKTDVVRSLQLLGLRLRLRLLQSLMLALLLAIGIQHLTFVDY